MKKAFIILISIFTISSCKTVTPVPYIPNPQNVDNPISMMKSIIKQQPAAYAYMPTAIEVDEECIKLLMDNSGPLLMPVFGRNAGVVVAPGAGSVSAEHVCYKNIGKVGLSHLERDNLWRVEIDDKNGNYMYWVYSYEKSDAQRFIDAISNFVRLQR